MFNALEQRLPDQCRVIDPGIVSEGGQDHCDQTAVPAYGFWTDATMAFEPHGEHLKAFGCALLLRGRFQGFNPADCDEMPQELADLPIGTPG